MHVIDIYRGNLLLIGIKPSNDSTQVKGIMAENEIRVNFTWSQYLDFRVGDKALVFGEWYYLMSLPQVNKISSREYEYVMVMKSTNSILSNVQYLFLGDDNSLKEGDFSLTGTATDFVKLLLQNTKRLLPDFDFYSGLIDTTGYKTITFTSSNCLDALGQIAEAFDTEYWVEGLRISISKIARNTGYEFKHGYQKGLYELLRKDVDNTKVVTRVYPFGSDKNIPENYRNFSRRLKLPAQAGPTVSNVTWSIVDNMDTTSTITFNFTPPSATGITALTILRRPIGSTGSYGWSNTGSHIGPRDILVTEGQWEFIFRTNFSNGTYVDSLPVAAISSTYQPALQFSGDIIFIEKNVEKYGLSEATIIFDDIYPNRTGTVTGINISNFYQFTDSGIDFDVNDYLLPGATAKLTFNTGSLSGYTFEISSFDNANKRFSILKNKDERSIDIPSDDLKPAIGDKYVITDIKMPKSYIDAAESELKSSAQSFLDKSCEPQVAYELSFDPVYLKRKKYEIRIGDLIHISDSNFNVNRKLRVISGVRGIVEEYDFKIQVADAISQTKLQAIQSGQTSLTQSVSDINSNYQNNATLNNRIIGDLIITDQGAIKFENLSSKSGITPIGIDSEGRIFKL